MNFDKIYLTGFMTSGKSTIGPILANVIGWEFYDLDKEIVKEQKKSIDDIFKKGGEKHFRELETIKLTELSNRNRIIIALGGGTLVNEFNLKLIKNTGKLIYLKSSVKTIYRRIKNKTDRPLFSDLVLNGKPEKEFMERIQSIITEREPYYNKADLIVNTDDHNIGNTIDYIARIITRMLNEKN